MDRNVFSSQERDRMGRAAMKRESNRDEGGAEHEAELRVREALPIADAIARRMAQRLGGVVSADELLGLAHETLVDAARAHDPARSPFAPYLVMRLKWAMLEEARRLGRKRKLVSRVRACEALERVADAEEPPPPAVRLTTEAEDQAELSAFLAQRAAALAVGLVSVAPGERWAENDEETPEAKLSREELRRDVRSAIEELPERQRALVRRHYFGGESFEAIAGDLGVSKSWASRLHAQAMAQLAEALRRDP